MDKFTEVFPLRISAKMYKLIERAADRQYMTMAQFLRKLIHEALEKK